MYNNILFINPLEKDIHIIIYKQNNYTEEKTLQIHFLHFAEEFPKILTKIVQENNIQEIWTFSGPWAFTKMRIITLSINALKFSFPNIIIKSTNFLNIFDTTLTPIIQANNTEFLVKIDEKIDFFTKETLPLDRQYLWYIDTSIDRNFISYKNDIQKIFSLFSSKEPVNFLSPIYLKNPHITCPKNSNTTL